MDATIRHAPRLLALRRSGLLDTPPEAAFDRLTRLVRRVLQVPIALLSLVDTERQFLKSALGLPEPWAARRETPLSHSVCQHVVACGAPLPIHDARSHPLVRDSLAVPELGVVAYLGVPLALPEGQVIGALAAIDCAPRAWTAEEVEALRDLAGLAVDEMALRRLTGELETRVAEEVAAREAALAERTKAQRREGAVGVESDSESMPATTVIAQFVVRSIRSRQPVMRPISERWKWARAVMASVEVEGSGGWGSHPTPAATPVSLRRLSMAVLLPRSGGG